MCLLCSVPENNATEYAIPFRAVPWNNADPKIFGLGKFGEFMVNRQSFPPYGILHHMKLQKHQLLLLPNVLIHHLSSF